MVLPHFDPVGKSNDIEVILGSEVMEDCEEGILGLEANTKPKSVTSTALVHMSPDLETARHGQSQG